MNEIVFTKLLTVTSRRMRTHSRTRTAAHAHAHAQPQYPTYLGGPAIYKGH